MSDITPTSQTHGDMGAENPISSPSPKRPWLFQRGQSGNPGGRPKVGQSAPQLLRAMRHCTSTVEARDKTQLQKECRAWLHEDRKGFLSKYADLERALAASQAKAGAAERIKELEAKNAELEARLAAQVCEPDPGTERIVDLMDELTAQYHREVVEKDAQLAAMQGAAERAFQLQKALSSSAHREKFHLEEISELRRKIKELEITLPTTRDHRG